MATNMDAVRCAQTGSAMASIAMSAVGTQTYETPDSCPHCSPRHMDRTQRAPERYAKS
ncbi:hypothetical protein HW130_33380 [Streptomyces sp. PKU-EA00015]|uniref:hypothetical protein n=1 Tax=Streptomyces sp. PKU-EA00015 TaxID=2748326 RepID=UPI00159FF7A8|nr:hypothetical protein [Streptomyces sp. PKU-EA00015]NWF31079.1 hypothetical protein [Streptomyces sp. PKU-EA00015]